MSHGHTIPACNCPIINQNLDMLSQHAMHKQGIPACNWPIGVQGSLTHYPNMLCIDKLCQHAFHQLKAREGRHTIQACS